MQLKSKYFGSILLCWLLSYSVPHAQSDTAMLEVFQDSLSKLGYTMYNDPAEPNRLEANFTFVKTLVSALKVSHSFDFGFDSLLMISMLRSPDESFRIFSWHLPLNDGSYLYYGAIQLRTQDGSLKLFPLLDKTYEITNPEEVLLSNDVWYGAQYYHIIPVSGAYLLLGWKGHTPYITQKVIEVVQIGEKGVKLGQPLFEDNSGHVRKIYQYNREVSMYMNYDKQNNRIVLDHLSPFDEQHIGRFETYGPDMSHDAWLIRGSKLILEEDILFQNDGTSADEMLFYDPQKPQNHPKSGLN